MKKQIIALLILTPMMLVGCKKQESLSRETISTTSESTSESQTTTTSESEPTASTLTDDQLPLFPSLFVKKLSSFNTYKSETAGETKTSMANQSINVTVIKGDYSYLLNESHSLFVNTVHTAYFHKEEAVSKDQGGSFAKSALSDYLSKYGTYPLDYAIEGYTITNESVKSVTRMESESDYKFKVVFDKDKSTNNVKIQMKQFGNLGDYPSFTEDTVMEITVKNDFTPVSLSLVSKYKANFILDVDCEQVYTVTYSQFNETIEVPNLSDVKDMFNK